MIVEMRTYLTKPGRRSEFLEIFRSLAMPEHDAIGMRILGPFISTDNPDAFFMRGFPDLQSRDDMKEKFYEGTLWKNHLEGLLIPMLERYDVLLVDDPEKLIRFGSRRYM